MGGGGEGEEEGGGGMGGRWSRMFVGGCLGGGLRLTDGSLASLPPFLNHNDQQWLNQAGGGGGMCVCVWGGGGGSGPRGGFCRAAVSTGNCRGLGMGSGEFDCRHPFGRRSRRPASDE